MSEQTCFSTGNLLRPGALLDKVLNDYSYQQTIPFHGSRLSVCWTRRAERELKLRHGNPLTVEMQLYFSCMIKKRVLFPETARGASPVNRTLQVLFRTVQATSCDPVEFATNYPEKLDLISPGARKMRPGILKIDFRKGAWLGEFEI